MIKTFADKETRKVFNRQYSRKLPINIQKTAWRKLQQIDAASVLDTLRVPPSNRLEALKEQIVKVNIVSALINSGEFVLSGEMVMLMRLRLWIITRRR